MSISTASACFPEMSLRAAMSAARNTPRPTIAQTYIQSLPASCGAIASSITCFVTQTSAICAPWDATASTIETTSETRYGRRKPSSRKNVRRYGTALTVEI